MRIRKFIGITILLFASLVTASAITHKDERVAVDITVKAQKKGAMGLSLKKSPLCQSYCLGLFTADIATHIGDGSLAQYFSNQKAQKHSADTKNASLLDFGFVILPEKEYTLLALAYDKDGNPGLVTRTNFTTPKRVAAGAPKMTWQIMSVGPDSVSVKFTPNADVAGFALCQFEAGSMDKAVEQHGRLLGFSNAYDMIKRFSGKNYTTERINTWRDMIPNTDYELCVLPWDKNGVFLDIDKVKVTTQKLGGPGEAAVDIQIGEFGGSESTGYYQIVIYTPNDQAALHRDIIITEEAFNKPDMGEAGVIKMLQTDAPNDPYWNQYKTDRAQWNSTPNTTYIACSMAKNVNGEWGKLKQVKFTTPAKQ
ncbi:hypothetical protein [Prevotella sp. KH2C16]|uniref:hypothetical protein n=1 Tax=Prevotella sp. KH2C16 TaxID=1855325 RepID=UPI0008EF6129|nr:hypothetical protein [Prevotella sp. KH2C16]SFF87906.1 hypothetical protein SAMN05216383_101336 [Prevotella sp. KH2C16]